MSSARNPADRSRGPVAVPDELAAAVAAAVAGTDSERAFRARLDVDRVRDAAATDPVAALHATRVPRAELQAVLRQRAEVQARIRAWLWQTAELAARAAGLAAGDDGLVLFVCGGCPEHGGALQQVEVVRGDVTVTFGVDTVEGAVAEDLFDLLREALVAARTSDAGADVIAVWPARRALATFRRRCTGQTDGWVGGEAEQLLLDLAALDLPDVDTDGWDAYDTALDAAETDAIAAFAVTLELAGLSAALGLGRWAEGDATADSGCADR